MKELLGRNVIKNIGITDEVYYRLRKEITWGVFNGMMWFAIAISLGSYILGFIKGVLR